MGLDILEEGEIEPDKLFPCETRPLGLLERGQHQVITVLPGLGLSYTPFCLLEAGPHTLSSLCLGLGNPGCGPWNISFVPLLHSLLPQASPAKGLSMFEVTTELTVQMYILERKGGVAGSRCRDERYKLGLPGLMGYMVTLYAHLWRILSQNFMGDSFNY